MPKPQVMIVGTFHMRHTTDLVAPDAGNVFSAAKQREIKKVIDSLEQFKPNRIAVEVIKEDNQILNEEYQKYIHEDLEAEVNEVHQIGFPLAKLLGHSEVYAVDWMGTVGNRGIGNVLKWAEFNQPDLYEYIEEAYLSKEKTELKDKRIDRHVYDCNREESVKKEHELNLAIARIGKDKEYIGIDWVRWWYQRNLIIYSNIAEITKQPTDRTLMIVGHAHVHILSQLLKESGCFDVFPATDYLQKT
ncbi:DUF5694 domain-containing protein [Halobacillus litoralis]|uniref:DUF5694 domain-containing protein n=1 Tax=Halobacillus litoralis TaxID=45668 RepID=UPI0024901D10|nr:DUF5694 domain-containing protein [Halobacillus litoralis]